MNSQKTPIDYSLKVPQTPSISEKLPLSRFSPAPVNLLKRSKLPLNSPNSLKLLEFPQNSPNSLETPQTPSKLPEVSKTLRIPSKLPKLPQTSNSLKTPQIDSELPKLSRKPENVPNLYHNFRNKRRIKTAYVIAHICNGFQGTGMKNDEWSRIITFCHERGCYSAPS